MGPQFISPSWEEIHQLTVKVAGNIKSDGFLPDVIVGIARGGWVPARIFSDEFPGAELTSLGVTFYTGISETEHSPKLTHPLAFGIADKRVLLVDDVVDTGRSLKAAVGNIQQMKPGMLKVATVYKKPDSLTEPDYYGTETAAWIIFPWEKSESARNLAKKLQAQGHSGPLIRKQLIRLGLDPKAAEARVTK